MHNFNLFFCRLAGSYEALEAGNPAEALVDFTGGVSETVDLVQGNHANDLEKRKELFQKLYKYMDRESLVSASIKVRLINHFINIWIGNPSSVHPLR